MIRLTLAVALVVALYLAVGAVGRAVDHEFQRIDRAIACNANPDCELQP